MGKFKMRTGAQFLAKKRLYDVKKDPVWVYLENEMRANIGRKPYNEKVGNWLKFLKELKHFYYCEAQSKLRRLERDVGPCWYVEFSEYQREVLGYLRNNIHVDLIENSPTRVAQSLIDLGITLKFKRKALMNAMRNCQDDVGLFMWSLYETTYKASPSVLQKKYSRDAMIMMSSLVFVDLKDCIEALERMTAEKEPPPPVKTRPKSDIKKHPCPYLQRATQIRVYSNHPSGPRELAPKPLPLGYKVKLRTKASYTKLCEDVSFIQIRKQKYSPEAKREDRVCNYKFWDPPVRSNDLRSKDLAKKIKMIKLKAKQKFKSVYKNVQFHVGGVAFTGKVPNYILPNVTLVPTGYTIIHGGVAPVGKEFVTIIQGHWVHPRKIIEACDATCNCVEKWGEAVMEYMKKSTCQCGHLYDFTSNEGVCDEKPKYFHPPTRHGPYWVDLPKIFRLDPKDDFIRDCVDDALREKGKAMPTLDASDMSDKTLLEALLADLSDTPLLIPHLPEAKYLNNLLEWLRKRLRGKLTPKEHKKLLLVSQRKWLDLKHIDFRARAYFIPFTSKQLDKMTWRHRELVQELFHILLDDFVSRNRLKQLEQSRLYWPTTFYDAYPCKHFLDTFYTYLPGRMQDTFLINPYCAEEAGKLTPKVCPIFKPFE